MDPDALDEKQILEDLLVPSQFEVYARAGDPDAIYPIVYVSGDCVYVTIDFEAPVHIRLGIWQNAIRAGLIVYKGDGRNTTTEVFGYGSRNLWLHVVGNMAVKLAKNAETLENEVRSR